MILIAAGVAVVAGALWAIRGRGPSAGPHLASPPPSRPTPASPADKASDTVTDEATAPRGLDDLLAQLAAFRRVAYLPVVREGDGPAAASKFSGTPLLQPGEDWPECGHCGHPMQLFVQLAASEVPEPARGRIGAGNVFQLFHCINFGATCMGESWAPFDASTLARLVRIDGAVPARQVPEGRFPPKTIVGWTAADDYPGYDEMDDVAAEWSDDETDTLCDAFPLPGEKLLGWPLWVQSVEYPACRTCGERMEVLFQVDSEQNLPYMFGDAGIGHVTQCPNHPGELAFGWACS